jgi:hypothetical protein
MSSMHDEAVLDSHDDEAPFQVPEGFRVAADPPEELALAVQKRNEKADELVGRKIMYKWPVDTTRPVDGWPVSGWCVGKIVRRNHDVRRKVEKQIINFHVFYEIDGQEAAHALSLFNYYTEGTGKADYHRWVLLEEVKE